MRIRRFFPVLVFTSLLMLPAALAFAQQQDTPPDFQAARSTRPNLLATLGLTPDQIQQIKQINRERRPQVQEAVRRLREANRALDAAVYSDIVNESEFQTRLSEFQAAQTEVARLRFESELAIRKILTPDQIVRFRELRRKFAEARDKIRPDGGRATQPGNGRLRSKPLRSPTNDL